MAYNCLCDKLLECFCASLLHSFEQPLFVLWQREVKYVTFCVNFQLIICDYVLKQQICTPLER